MGILSDVGSRVLGSRVLVLNAGSSSLKFKLFDVEAFTPVMGGLVERIGEAANSNLVAKDQSEKIKMSVPIKDHTGGMKLIFDLLKDRVSPEISQEVRAVGHRIVHGFDISRPALLTDKVLEEIRKATTLAPLHNPPGLAGVSAAQQVFADVPQVGVFDTAFHQTMPPHAYMYALPYEFFEKHHIRRYGFHGTSYHYLVGQTAEMLNKPVNQVNMIACHLGNGSSMCAIKGGRCIDTTMGMTPLEGLMMGTRSGDIDPAIPLHLAARCGVSQGDLDTILNKKSGLLGVAGNNDLRAVIDQRAAGVERAVLAVDMFVYKVRKYIGAYLAALEGQADALVFSAGIGENSSLIRGLICSNLEAMGIAVEPSKNEQMVGGQQGDISSPASSMRVLVIPTDEEVSIARQTIDVVLESGQVA